MPKLLASIAAAKIADSFLFIENSLLSFASSARFCLYHSGFFLFSSSSFQHGYAEKTVLGGGEGENEGKGKSCR